MRHSARGSRARKALAGGRTESVCAWLGIVSQPGFGASGLGGRGREKLKQKILRRGREEETQRARRRRETNNDPLAGLAASSDKGERSARNVVRCSVVKSAGLRSPSIERQHVARRFSQPAAKSLRVQHGHVPGSPRRRSELDRDIVKSRKNRFDLRIGHGCRAHVPAMNSPVHFSRRAPREDFCLSRCGYSTFAGGLA